jgi:two-component system response regulator
MTANTSNQDERRDALTILLVDDDEDDLFFLKHAFKTCTWTSLQHHTVHNGEQAIKFLQESITCHRMPDLVLLDWNMPLVNGRGVLEWIQSQPEYVALPVIVLTTSDQPSDVKQAYELGARSFIKKPFSFDELVDVVKLLRSYWARTVELPLLSMQ